MNLTRWEPFREMEELFRQYAPFTSPSLRRRTEAGAWAPISDITETDKEYLIKAELPEVKKEDVKIMLENGVITISGERKQQKEHKEENEIRIESFQGAFARSFALPDNVDAGAIHAESKDGVLRVHLPKSAVAPPRTVSIEVQ